MSENQEKAKSIFLNAAELASSAERSAYVAAQCGGDEALLREVDDLLRHQAEMASAGELRPGDETIDQGDAAIREGVGTPIGPYKLLQQIGEGGMGVVFLAEQQRPVRRQVALKVIKAGMDTRQVVARFESERQALALMDHPNIAKVLDAGTTDTGRPYFVMELVKGLPITKYCDAHHIEPRQRLELFMHVCQAVQHAHQKGIIHRDLKPCNVLIAQYDGEPAPKVIDFGVAKATGQRLTERTMFTGFGDVIGTIEYMSPEQAEVNQLDVDTRSDIYSLGVLLYELLTGSTPLEHKRVMNAGLLEMLRVVREEEPPKPSTRLSTAGDLPSIAASRGLEPKKLSGIVQGELDWIVMKALEKDRNRRYETANGLALDVQRYLADEAVHACPPSIAYRVRKFARRNRGPVLAGVVIFLLLAAGVIGTSLGLLQALKEAGKKETALQAETIQRQRAEANAGAARRQENEALKQTRAAEQQAAIARAVTDFLNSDLLQQADVYKQDINPEAPPDRDLKVRDALDRAAGLIGERFENQPLVEAAIRHILGATYRHLGDYAKAEEHLARALQLRRENLGEEHVETLKTLTQLGSLHINLRDFARAEPELEQALKGLIRSLGEREASTCEAMRFLALCYRVEGHPEKAESLALRSVEIARNDGGGGAERPQTLRALRDLAAVYAGEGKYAEAEPILNDVLAAQSRVRGAQHPETLSTVQVLADLYLAQKQFAKAEPLLVQAVDGMRKVFGEEDPKTLTAMLSLGLLYQQLEEYGKAEPLQVQALDGLRRVFGELDRQSLNALDAMGWLYLRQGKYAKAEPLLLQVLEGRRKVLGERNGKTLDSLRALARLYTAAGKHAETEKTYRALLTTQRSVLGDEHVEVAQTLVRMADSLRLQNKLADAESAYREGLAIQRNVLGEEDIEVASTLYGLAAVLRSQKKLPETEELYRHVLAIRRNVLRADHQNIADVLLNLTSLLLSQKRYKEAEPLALECLEIRRKGLPKGHWMIADTKSSLGAALSGQGKYEEAEPLLLAGYQELLAEPPPAAMRRRTGDALDRIVELYEMWGKNEEGAKWRAKLSGP
jgi:serine/threonine protein kinase